APRGMWVRVPPFAPSTLNKDGKRGNARRARAARLDDAARGGYRAPDRCAAEAARAQHQDARLPARQGADEARRADLRSAGALRSAERIRAEVVHRGGEGSEPQGRRVSA